MMNLHSDIRSSDMYIVLFFFHNYIVLPIEKEKEIIIIIMNLDHVS